MRKYNSKGTRDTRFYRDVFLRSTGKSFEELQDPRFQIEYISRELISPDPNQPRKDFDEVALEDLAVSIRSAGRILQPLFVRKMRGGKFRIIAGERRWRAAGMIGLEKLPCIVMPADARDVRIISLIENVQREDLNAVELARGLRELIDLHGLTHNEAALAVGCSRTHVTNLLRILELDVTVLDHLDHGRIDMGHARALANLDHDAQRRLVRSIVDRGWTVRRVEQVVRQIKSGRAGGRPTHQANRALMDLTAKSLSHAVGGRVAVKALPSGKISVVLEDEAALEKLISMLGSKEDSNV